jgi:glutamate receptor, ionotropic, invertebrate
MLHTFWWGKGAQVCENTDDKKKDSANELGLDNVGGVFVVLIVGLCISFVVAILEFIWKARQSADDRVSS